MIKFTDSNMSVVTVDLDKGIVTKEYCDNQWTKIKDSQDKNGFERELKWLNVLKDFDRVPKIKEIVMPNKIIMTYCGEQIKKETVPKDWGEQAAYIINGLKKYNCCHNDIKPEEILIKDGLLYLIDYNWATEIGEKIPDWYPPKLGCKYKKDSGFDDKYSFVLSMVSVINNTIDYNALEILKQAKDYLDSFMEKIDWGNTK